MLLKYFRIGQGVLELSPFFTLFREPFEIHYCTGDKKVSTYDYQTFVKVFFEPPVFNNRGREKICLLPAQFL